MSVVCACMHLCLASGLKLVKSQEFCSLQVQNPDQSYDQPGNGNRIEKARSHQADAIPHIPP